jgi:hypothetical protein
MHTVKMGFELAYLGRRCSLFFSDKGHSRAAADPYGYFICCLFNSCYRNILKGYSATDI